MQRIRKLSQTFIKQPELPASREGCKPEQTSQHSRKLSKSNRSIDAQNASFVDPGREEKGHRPRKLSLSSIMSSVKASASQTSLLLTGSQEKARPLEPEEKPGHRMKLQRGQHSEIKHCKSMPFQRSNKPTYKGGQAVPKDVVIRRVKAIDLDFTVDGDRTPYDSYYDSSADGHSSGHGHSPTQEASYPGLPQSRSAVQLRPGAQATLTDNPYGMSDSDLAFMKNTYDYLEQIGQPMIVPPHLQPIIVPSRRTPSPMASTPSPIYDGPIRAPPRQQVPSTPPAAEFPLRPDSPDSCYSQDSYGPCPTAIDRALDQTEKALAAFWPPTPKVPGSRQAAILRNLSSTSGQNQEVSPVPKHSKLQDHSRNFTGQSRVTPVVMSRPGPPRAHSPEFFSTPNVVPSSHKRYPDVAPVRLVDSGLDKSSHRRNRHEPHSRPPPVSRNTNPESSSGQSSRHGGSSSRTPKTTKISTSWYTPAPSRADPARTYQPPRAADVRPAGPPRAQTTTSTSAPHSQPQPQRFNAFATPARPARPAPSRAPASAPTLPCPQYTKLPPLQTSQAERPVLVHQASTSGRHASVRVVEVGVVPSTGHVPAQARMAAAPPVRQQRSSSSVRARAYHDWEYNPPRRL